MDDLKEKKNSDGSVTLHHPETNQPLFNIGKSNYGREAHLSWHPSMTEMHPHLATGHEHTLSGYNGHITTKNKSEAKNKAHNTYITASRQGFRDTIDHEHSTMSDGEFNIHKKQYESDSGNKLDDKHYGNYEEKLKKVVHYKDPHTGETIGSSKFDAKTGDISHKFNSRYLDNNNIDRDTLNAVNKGKTYYNSFKNAFLNKGKKARLTGVSQNKGHKVYQIKTTPEDGSAAHEEHVRKTLPTAEITRHSPTSFTAYKPSTESYSHGKMITSNVIGDKLHHVESEHENHTNEYRGKNDQVIERALFKVGKQILEDSPTNAAGNGAVAGIGIGPQGEPPVKIKNRLKNIFKRK